ncbi:hypothetical protein RDI58_019475 [Solanum bulbocastanum]|uniref:F-box domain-containing protein n=1 Tax=Solanum bulbocastanum TaxID=147425 RepID=A0AAN8T5B7_SOLBU
MAKKSKKREDRLSDLPDSILIHILSMLHEDGKRVVRSSVLSKRWQFLWMSVPVSLEIRFPNRSCFGPSDGAMEKILSGCPNLEYLQLERF